MNPSNHLEWYTQKYCSKCKNHICEKKGTGVYTTQTDYIGKLACILSANLMVELDRPLSKKLGK